MRGGLHAALAPKEGLRGPRNLFWRPNPSGLRNAAATDVSRPQWAPEATAPLNPRLRRRSGEPPSEAPAPRTPSGALELGKPYAHLGYMHGPGRSQPAPCT